MSLKNSEGQAGDMPDQPDNYQLPPNVTINDLPMGGDNPVGGMPSAPSFEAVQGYGDVSFSDALLKPPSYDEAIRVREPPTSPGFYPVPLITEAEARLAMLEHCSENCCYGKGAATEMVMSKIQSSAAFHYILESFGEARSTAWASIPYRGGPVDGPMNGPAPLPWTIPVHAAVNFKDEKKHIEVPRTAYLKKCHKCFGMGRLRCHHCHGLGRVRCMSCNGGHTTVNNHRSICGVCGGSSFRNCVSCCGHGHVRCPKCQGTRKLKWFIQLTVTWTNHLEDYILERTAMPDEKVREVQGQVVFEEEGMWVYPVSQFPEPLVNGASADLVAKHRVQFPTERILLQRHKIRVVPVTEVEADWKDEHFTFFVYGLDHKVYSYNYPQACCWGCTLL